MAVGKAKILTFIDCNHHISEMRGCKIIPILKYADSRSLKNVDFQWSIYNEKKNNWHTFGTFSIIIYLSIVIIIIFWGSVSHSGIIPFFSWTNFVYHWLIVRGVGVRWHWLQKMEWWPSSYVFPHHLARCHIVKAIWTVIFNVYFNLLQKSVIIIILHLTHINKTKKH